MDENIGQHLSDLVNLILRGGLADEMNDVICGENLLNVSKEDEAYDQSRRATRDAA